MYLLKRQEGFAPIIILVVIISLIGGGILVSQKIKRPATNLESQVQTTPQPKATDSAQPETKKESQSTTLQSTARSKNSPTPQPTLQAKKTGTLKGKVAGGHYLKPLPDTTVKIKGEGVEKSSKTDTNGIFTFTKLPVGKYTLSFSHPDYNISDVNSLTVSEGETFYDRTINGFLKVIKPTTIKGIVYIDRNDNRQKDSGEEGLNASIGIYNKVGDSWALNQTLNADSSGNFSLEVKEDGISYKLVPNEYTFYRKPSPVEFVVEGYGETRDFSFPYYPTSSTAKITLYVFNDKNENNLQDADEENIDFYYAEITNISTGKNEKTSVSANGVELRSYDFGAYNVKLIAGSEAWAGAYKITKSQDLLTITNSSGDQTIKLGARKL